VAAAAPAGLPGVRHARVEDTGWLTRSPTGGNRRQRAASGRQAGYWQMARAAVPDRLADREGAAQGPHIIGSFGRHPPATLPSP